MDIILLKECLWHDPASYQLINQRLELLMVEQGYQQQAILTKIQTFNRQKRQHIAQSQAQRALPLTPAKTLMSRNPHYSLPASLTEPVLTFLLQTPLVERYALQQWLSKGGASKTRLNGIGFAQGVDARINAQHQLEIVDISLQPSLLGLTENTLAQTIPAALLDDLEKVTRLYHQQRSLFHEQQNCLFITQERVARIEASLLDLSQQLAQAKHD